MAAHHHPFHELIVIIRGEMRVEMPDKHIHAKPGDVLFYRSGVPHEETAVLANPVESAFLSFTWPDAPKDIPVVVQDLRGRIRQMASWLHEEFVAGGKQAAATCAVFFEALVTEWLRLAQHREHPVVETVRDYVLKHIAEPLTLGDLAATAGMSKYHFARTYKKITGRTPLEEVRAMRVQHARGLILTTNLPMKAIAPLAGFGDEYRLSRVFRKVLGIRPGEIRAQTARPRST